MGTGVSTGGTTGSGPGRVPAVPPRATVPPGTETPPPLPAPPAMHAVLAQTLCPSGSAYVTGMPAASAYRL